jgi:hypothetical protein
MIKQVLLAGSVMFAAPVLAQTAPVGSTTAAPTQSTTAPTQSTAPTGDAMTAQTSPATPAPAAPADPVVAQQGTAPADAAPAQTAEGTAATSGATTPAQPAPAQSAQAGTTEPGAAAGGSQVAQIVEREFASYDKDGDGKLSQIEFSAWMVALKSASDPTTKADAPETKQWVGAAFTQADADKNRGITKTELTGFLSQGQQG